MGGLLGRRSKHRIDAGPQVLGAWSPNLDRDLDPLTRMEQVGLACAWGTSDMCAFRVPSWAILIRESPFICDGTTWLWYSTVVRNKTWKEDKMVLIAYHMLESSIGAYIEWSDDELTMTANKKIKYKDAHLVMLPAVAITHSQITLHTLGILLFSLDG
jgi:hypothetical protein